MLKKVTSMRKVQEPLPWFHTSAVMNYDGLETNGVTSGATNGATNGVTIVAMVSIVLHRDGVTDIVPICLASLPWQDWELL